MKVPYPKPATLSDPYFDWDGSEEEIARVVASDPASLGQKDFWMIFYQNLPAANYQEGCYYVPYFLDFYSRAPDFKSPNLEGFFWYVDHFRSDFERDGLLQPILDRIWKIFLRLTECFSIHRLSDVELVSYGICPSYREMAPRARTAAELLDCFTAWPVFDPLLDKLRAHFATVTTTEKSFWFCECAFHTRLWLWVDSEPIERRQALFDDFHRLANFSAHYQNSFLSRDHRINEGYFQYNQRLAPM